MTALLISQIFIVITLEQNLKPRVQTLTGKKFFTYKGIDLWGKIKSEVKKLSWVSLKKR